MYLKDKGQGHMLLQGYFLIITDTVKSKLYVKCTPASGNKAITKLLPIIK